MTDHLETDLRALLARRAGEVTADADLGETAIGRRLASGDVQLADIVAMRSPSRRPWFMAAAAVLVVAIGAVAVLSRDDEPSVQTGPSATTPTSPAAVLEFRPVILAGPCTGLVDPEYRSSEGDVCYQLGDPLPGNELIQSVSRFTSFSGTGVAIGGGTSTTDTTAASDETEGVQLTLTPDGIEQFNALALQCFERVAICPTGQLAVVVDGLVLSAPTIEQPGFEADQIQIPTSLTAAEADALAASLPPRSGSTSTSPPPVVPGDPAVGQPGDSAKEVAERVMRDVLDDESVTTESGDRADGDTFVTMVTSTGAEVTAIVTFDDALEVFRLVGLQTAKLQPFRDAGYLSIPHSGHLTMAYLPTLESEPTLLIADLPIDHAGTDHGPFVLPDEGWLSITLVTDDGRILHHLSQR